MANACIKHFYYPGNSFQSSLSHVRELFYFNIRFDCNSFLIRLMDRIRRKLFRDYPYTKELLQPTHYVDAADFKPGKDIRESYRHIKNEMADIIYSVITDHAQKKKNRLLVNI